MTAAGAPVGNDEGQSASGTYSNRVNRTPADRILENSGTSEESNTAK